MKPKPNRVAWTIAAIVTVVVSVVPGVSETNVVPLAVPGRTPLMLAALNNDTDRVKVLLTQGVDVNARDENGMTALMWAAPHAALLLIEGGADVHARDNFGRTALTFGAYQRSASKVRALLARGADVDPRDCRGRTPLFCAIRPTILTLFATALSHLPDQRSLGDLLEASRGPEARMPEVVSLLLDRSANPNARDDRGLTPLLLYSEWNGWEKEDDKHRSIPGYLLAKGADVNAQDNEGWTALMSWAYDLETPMVKLLLEHGADAKAEQVDGRTALTMASQGSGTPQEREQVLTLLREAESAGEAKKAKHP